MGSPRRPGLSILVKLILAFVLPTVALFGVFAVIAHQVARSGLEHELGARLAGIAGAASTHVRDPSLARLERGAEDDPRHTGCRLRLRAVAEQTGVSRIYVFTREGLSVCDTRQDVPIGAQYHQVELDRHELAGVFDAGQPRSSILFQGAEGKLYKAGYAPALARDDQGAVVLAVGVDAPAEFFDQLSGLRRTLLLYGIGFAAVVLLVSVIMAALITRPVRTLADAAVRIGRGDLRAPVESSARDELGVLAATMEEMRRGLRERDERMQLMLSGIAHEVRNPLGGIELFAGLLREQIPAEDPRRKHVQRIEKELRYLASVVGDFLEYARRPDAELAPVAIGQLIQEVMQLAGAEAVGLELRCELPPEGNLSCLADERQLRRALLNLVRNAVQAADGVAGVSLRREGSQVCVQVWNQGEPISPEVRERMFEPFFTTKEKGTGLGLAFVRETVVDSGGTIEVRSSRQEGTVFELRFRYGNDSDH